MISFRDSIKVLWGMSAPVRWRMVVSLAVGLVRIAASLAFVWASKQLVDIATGQSSFPLWPAIWIFVGVLVLQVTSFLASGWWENYCQVKTQNILRAQLFGHVLRSRWDGRDRFLSGDTVNRLEEDIRVVAELLSARIPGLVVTLLQLVAASTYLLMLAPNLLWVLLTITVIGGLVLSFNRFRCRTVDGYKR